MSDIEISDDEGEVYLDSQNNFDKDSDNEQDLKIPRANIKMSRKSRI